MFLLTVEHFWECARVQIGFPVTFFPPTPQIPARKKNLIYCIVLGLGTVQKLFVELGGVMYYKVYKVWGIKKGSFFF